MTQTSGFAEALIALGQHMKQNPDLPTAARVGWMYTYGPVPNVAPGLDIQIGGGDAARVLPVWAATLTEVRSEAKRNNDGTVYGYVYGALGDVPVCVWASGLDADAFPEGGYVHEWDVTVQLQEA